MMPARVAVTLKEKAQPPQFLSPGRPAPFPLLRSNTRETSRDQTSSRDIHEKRKAVRKDKVDFLQLWVLML